VKAQADGFRALSNALRAPQNEHVLGALALTKRGACRRVKVRAPL
jgi:hypothetical protein